MRLIIPLFIVLILFLTGGWVWWNIQTKPVDPSDTERKVFVIPKGQSVSAIGSRLQKEGLVKSAFAFKFYTQLTGNQGNIQAGSYRISPDLSLSQVVELLLRGPEAFWVVYPEGIRREEMAVITIETLGLSGSEAASFWQEFLSETSGEEGFLFPDSYLFPDDISASRVADNLRATFDQRVTEQMIIDAGNSGLSLEQVLTLASIVEREAKGDERVVVSGIILKRLNAGWPLQADATMQYVTGGNRCGNLGIPEVLDCDWWVPPTAADKALRSPYNTYAQPGLPPAPIANPGISSIHAAIYPEDSPYWFYLHGADGTIHYAETAEEHQENINKYLK